MARTVTLPPRKVKTTVVALQGHPVAPDMPAVGDTLVWDGNEWTPTPAIGRSNRAGETQNLDTTVVGIQGTPVFPIGPVVQPGDALLWTGIDWKNYPVAKDLSAANLGPYLPISAYTPPDGGGGNFLPLTGGVLSGPGALTVGDALTLAGAASAGGNSFIDMQGGSAVVQADGNGLLLQQLGDQYGLTSLLIANRDGLNGAMFTNEGLDLVDFAFQTSTGVTGTLRLDARSIPTGQFSFMLSGNTLLAVDSAGNVVCVGSLSAVAGTFSGPLQTEGNFTVIRASDGIPVFSVNSVTSDAVSYNFTATNVLAVGSSQQFFLQDQSPTQRVLQWATGWTDVWLNADGRREWNSSTTTLMSLDYAGNVSIAGTLVQGSDEGRKKNIDDISNGLELIKQLLPKSFQWVDGDDSEHWGFIAQDVQEVIPSVVKPFKDSLGLEEMGILATVVAAIKELATRVEALEAAP